MDNTDLQPNSYKTEINTHQKVIAEGENNHTHKANFQDFFLMNYYINIKTNF